MSTDKFSKLTSLLFTALVFLLISDLVVDFIYFTFSALTLQKLQTCPWTLSGLLSHFSPVLGLLSTPLLIGIICGIACLGIFAVDRSE
jgi:hypothetical protein